jgi:hypothetical protein
MFHLFGFRIAVQFGVECGGIAFGQDGAKVGFVG